MECWSVCDAQACDDDATRHYFAQTKNRKRNTPRLGWIGRMLENIRVVSDASQRSQPHKNQTKRQRVQAHEKTILPKKREPFQQNRFLGARKTPTVQIDTRLLFVAKEPSELAWTIHEIALEKQVSAR